MNSLKLHHPAKALLLFLSFSIYVIQADAQTKTIYATESKAVNKLVIRSTNEIQKYNHRADQMQKKFIRKYKNFENKLNRKLCKKDPKLADKLFSAHNAPLLYKTGNEELTATISANKKVSKQYFAKLDTIKTSLNILAQNGASSKEMETATAELREMESNIYDTEALQQYFRNRKQQIKKAIVSHPDLEHHFTEIDKINYYYKEATSFSKNDFLTGIKKSDQQLLNALKNTDEFKSLISSSGQLATFAETINANEANIKGTQTLEQSNEFVQAGIKSLNMESDELIRSVLNPLQQINQTLPTLPNKDFASFADLPSFKPKPLKFVPLKDRLIYNTNYGFGPSNNFFPTSAGVDFSIGYQMHPKWVSGIGVSYELRTGYAWNKISFSTKSFGYKAYLDFNLYNIFYLQGAFERINNLEKDPNTLEQHFIAGQPKQIQTSWFNKGLIGLAIKKSVNKKSKATFSWSYDLLHNKHFPTSPAFIYRIGWQW
jgi:hypothetical protein